MGGVSKLWKELCTTAIECKLPLGKRKVFQTREELIREVQRYSLKKFQDTERYARSYGYPINRWDVSMVKDLSFVFCHQFSFNENISEWDASNATDMHGMFRRAYKFNQDISSWNVSNVT